jgi:hypothetical protein
MLAHFVDLVEELSSALAEFFPAATLEVSDENVPRKFGFHVRRTSVLTLME